MDFLAHFVAAAAEADRRFAGSREGSDIPDGIELWERLVAGGMLVGEAPETLVDAYLAAALLYARDRDAARALDRIDAAQRHVVPGSFSDLQARMSRAACLLVAYQAAGHAEDLDAAIAAWTELLDTDARVLAAANLGRALITRGRADDLPEGRRLLSIATAELPRDHPARGDVEFALRGAG